jgi:hypothetical protein
MYLLDRRPALVSMSPKTPEAAAEALVLEIERYLATVEFFRDQGCEPHWSSEAVSTVQTMYAGADSQQAAD